MKPHWVIGLALGATAIAGMAHTRDDLKSGIQKGDYVVAFHPLHVTGADRGTPTCPV